MEALWGREGFADLRGAFLGRGRGVGSVEVHDARERVGRGVAVVVGEGGALGGAVGRHLALVEGAEVGEAGLGCGVCIFFLIFGFLRRVVFGNLGECGAALAGAPIGVFPESAFFGGCDDLAAVLDARELAVNAIWPIELDANFGRRPGARGAGQDPVRRIDPAEESIGGGLAGQR